MIECITRMRIRLSVARNEIDRTIEHINRLLRSKHGLTETFEDIEKLCGVNSFCLIPRDTYVLVSVTNKPNIYLNKI